MATRAGHNSSVDPSENVKALSEAANKRQDDLREASQVLASCKYAHIKELVGIRAGYQEAITQLREAYQEKNTKAESGRLDSIRQVDREEVAKTAAAANIAIATLARQTTDLAQTLQKQVNDTAAAAEARNSTQYTDTNKRLSALELSSSEGRGKQTVADPAMERLVMMVERLAQGSAKSEGIDKVWGVIAVVVGLLISAAVFLK